MRLRDDHAGEYIDPTAVRYAAQKMKLETEVLSEHRLKKEEGPWFRRQGRRGRREEVR